MPDTPSNVESLTKAIGDCLEGLEPLFRFAVLASMPGSAEAFKQAFEDWKLYFEQQDKTLLAFTINHCLIGVERHFTSEQLWLLMRWNVEQGDSVVNRRLQEFVSLEQIRDYVNCSGHVPYFMYR